MFEFQKWLGWIDLDGLLKKDEVSSQKREEKDLRECDGKSYSGQLVVDF